MTLLEKNDSQMVPLKDALIEKVVELVPKIRERAPYHDRTGEFPHESLNELAELGALGAAIPERFGGLANDALFSGTLPTRLVYEVARGCGGTAWALLSHFHATGQMAGIASDEFLAPIFSEVIEEKKRIATIGSEVNIKETPSGEDKQLAIKTRGAYRDGDYLINGFKGFTSTAAYADYIVYWHMAKDSEDPSTGLLLSLIPRNREGIEFLPGWEDAMGIRCSASGPAKFTNLIIHKEEIMGEPSAWVQRHTGTHDILYAAVLTGLAREAYDQTLAAIRPRKDMYQDRAVMNYLGEMSSEVQAMEWGTFGAAQMWDEGEDPGEAHHATIRALHIAKAGAMAVTARAFELVGTRAVTRKAPFERIWRDARVASLHTREWQHMEWVARGDLTGDRFSKEKYGTKVSNTV